MRPVPASVKAPKLPQVNLMPPEIGQRKARRQARFVVFGALIVFVVFLVGLSYVVSLQKTDAQAELDQANQDLADLQAEAARYADVPAVIEAQENARAARAYAAATEIDWTTFFRSLDVFPSSMELAEFELGKVGLVSPYAYDTGPFSSPDIGSMRMVLFTQEPVNAADLSRRLDGVYGVDHVAVVVTERALDERDEDESEIVYVVEVNARLTYDLLTGRFGPEDGADAPVEEEAPAQEGSDS